MQSGVRCIKRGLPMQNSFDTEMRLRGICAAQVIVGLSALAATIVLLARVLPPLLIGFS